MDFITTDKFVHFSVIVLVGDFIALLLNMSVDNDSKQLQLPTRLLQLAYGLGILAAMGAGWMEASGGAVLFVLVAILCAVAIWPLTLWRLVVA